MYIVMKNSSQDNFQLHDKNIFLFCFQNNFVILNHSNKTPLFTYYVVLISSPTPTGEILHFWITFTSWAPSPYSHRENIMGDKNMPEKGRPICFGSWKSWICCHNPNSTSTQLKSWVWHEKDFKPPPTTTTHTNSMSSMSQVFLTRF